MCARAQAPRAEPPPSQTGVFHQKVEKLSPQQQMLADPSQMTNMLMGNLSNMVPQASAALPSEALSPSPSLSPLSPLCPQMVTFAWVNFFFSGYITARVPFPLTQRFRGMLQRGVELQSLDVTYVSSLSWYFLNLFGLNGLLGLCLGEATSAMQDPSMAMAQSQAAMMGIDASKAFVGERDALDAQRHDWALPELERLAATTLRELLDTRQL